MVIEAGHLEHLHHRQAHLGGQGHQVALEQAVEGVVERVQVLDQQVAAMALQGRFADEGADLAQRGGLGLTALELPARRGPHNADRLN